MDSNDIHTAIMLFQHSLSSRAGRGDAVLHKLRRMFNHHKISFHHLPRRTFGEYQSAGDRIWLNKIRITEAPADEQIGFLSLIIVHEGSHSVDTFDSLYSELGARQTAVHYYRELSGPGVNDAASGAAPKMVRVSQAHLPEHYDRESEALRKDQLIDFVLSIETYTDADYIDPQWIVDNMNNWGGLRNRWPSTLAVYLNTITDSDLFDPRYPPLILSILEGVRTRADWEAMMDDIDSMAAIRRVLARSKGHHDLALRMTALERRWRVDLSPPAAHHRVHH